MLDSHFTTGQQLYLLFPIAGALAAVWLHAKGRSRSAIELLTIVDAGRVLAPFDPQAFPAIPQASFLRTRTPVAGATGTTWGINTKYAVNLQANEVLAGPAELGCIDLRADNPEFFSWTADLTMSRHGTLHGLAGWFECELAENVWMTNSPLSAQAIKRSQAFLPIDGPLTVKAGEVISVTVMARPADHLIAWDVRHPASGRKFSHSTWLGDLLMQEQLNKTRPDHVPQLSRVARARALVMGYCDGQRSVGQIQSAVLQQHPNLFPSAAEITRFVASVLAGNTE